MRGFFFLEEKESRIFADLRGSGKQRHAEKDAGPSATLPVGRSGWDDGESFERRPICANCDRCGSPEKQHVRRQVFWRSGVTPITAKQMAVLYIEV